MLRIRNYLALLLTVLIFKQITASSDLDENHSHHPLDFYSNDGDDFIDEPSLLDDDYWDDEINLDIDVDPEYNDIEDNEDFILFDLDFFDWFWGLYEYGEKAEKEKEPVVDEKFKNVWMVKKERINFLI
jgi:hypothetical protein